MKRVLRIELRRSVARWLVLVPLPLAVLGVGEAGRGLNVIAYDQRQLVGLLSALVIGLAAWQGRRDRRSGMDELLATTPRPRAQRVLPAVTALALAAVAGYWLVHAGLAAYVAAVGGHLSASSLPVTVVGTLFFLVAVVLGLVAGRWLPFLAIPPLALVYLAASVGLADTEAYGDPPGTLLLWGGLEAHSRMAAELAAATVPAHLAQGVWALGLLVAGFIVFATTGRRARAAALVPVALGGAITLPLVPDRYIDAFYPDPGAIAAVCSADSPMVCVLRAHHLALPEVRAAGREALATLSAKLPQAPSRVAETYLLRESGVWRAGTPRPRTDTLYTVPWRDGMGRPGRDLPWMLLMGAGTLSCDNAPPWPSPARTRYDAARLVAAAWLLDEPPLSPTDRPEVWGWLPDRALTLPAYQALRGLPAAEQRKRVADLREAELACDSRDRMRILLS